MTPPVIPNVLVKSSPLASLDIRDTLGIAEETQSSES